MAVGLGSRSPTWPGTVTEGVSAPRPCRSSGSPRGSRPGARRPCGARAAGPHLPAAEDLGQRSAARRRRGATPGARPGNRSAPPGARALLDLLLLEDGAQSWEGQRPSRRPRLPALQHFHALDAGPHVARTQYGLDLEAAAGWIARGSPWRTGPLHPAIAWPTSRWRTRGRRGSWRGQLRCPSTRWRQRSRLGRPRP
jgi:hypothetical protein